MNTTGNTARPLSREELLAKQAELEAGFRHLERGLQDLGVRITNCREQFSGHSEIADMAVNASRLERKFLSLRKKFKATEEAPSDPGTTEAIRELSEKNRNQRLNTRAIGRETRRNSRILNSLSKKLKTELNKRRQKELKEAREKAAKVRMSQAPAKKPGQPKLRPVEEKSADILPFPVRGKR